MHVPDGYTTRLIDPEKFNGAKWAARVGADPDSFWISGTTLVHPIGLAAPTVADKPDRLKSDHDTESEAVLLSLQARRTRLVARGKATARVDTRIATLQARLDAAVDALP